MRKLLVLIIVVVLSGLISIQALASSNYEKIGVEVDGQKLDVEAYLVENRTLVPLRAIFEKLQAEVEWEESTQTIAAKKGSTVVKLQIDNAAAHVNSSNITLDVPPMLIDSRTFVPLRFVSESLGASVSYDANRQVAAIQTSGGSNGNGSANPSANLTAEPFVVKGHVTDKQGHPLAGVQVYADNQLYTNSYQSGVTDEDGYYEIDLAQTNTTWNMFAFYERKLNGNKFAFNPTSVTDQPFGANKGAVRDFVWDNINGMVKIGIRNYPENEDWPRFSLDDVELTLTPVSPLIDGSAGRVLTEMCTFNFEGPGIKSIPIADYKVTARWMPDGMAPMPLQVALDGTDKYADSVTASFKLDVGTTNRMGILVGFPQS